MITNASCTVFHLCSDGTFSRAVIPAVYFREAENIDSSAAVLSDSGEAVIFIPSESLTGYKSSWAVSKRDYICRGAADFDLTQKNVPEFRKRFDVYTVTSCEELFYGSRRLWHLKVRCKL